MILTYYSCILSGLGDDAVDKGAFLGGVPAIVVVVVPDSVLLFNLMGICGPREAP